MRRGDGSPPVNKVLSTIFKTEAGWAAALFTPRGEIRAFMLPGSRARALRFAAGAEPGKLPEFQIAVQRYFSGNREDFRKFKILPFHTPPFHKKVYRALRRVPYGGQLTYRQLALLAGNPRAARAVGAAMAKNPLPLLIPCHRVVRSDGGLGGFSAPRGVALKRMMLEMEKRLK